MNAHLRIYAMRRQTLEAKIEELIELLDLLDGDENMEPDHAGFDGRTMDDREGDDEREDDPAERGIGDEGGMAEQYACLFNQYVL